MLLASGVGRALWVGWFAIVPAGIGGLLLIVATDTLTLGGAGVFNPAFATFRTEATADRDRGRGLAAAG